MAWLNPEVSGILPLSNLGLEQQKENLLKQYYSGYCTVSNCFTPQILFFVSLCDASIIYKNKNILISLNALNQSTQIKLTSQEEQQVEQMLIAIYTIIDSQDTVISKLISFRNHVNSNFIIFLTTINKLLYASSFENFHNPENSALVKLGFEKLVTMIYSKTGIDFSYMSALIHKLEISVKIVFIDSFTCQDINQRASETQVFMKYSDNWCVLYPAETLLLAECDENEYDQIFVMVEKMRTDEIESVKTRVNEIRDLKTQQDKVIRAVAETFATLYPNTPIYDIKEKEGVKIEIGDILKDFVCGHCFKVCLNSLACGHCVCGDVFRSQGGYGFRCPSCPVSH